MFFEFFKEKFKVIIYIVLIILLCLVLFDDLTILENLKGDDLEKYSISKFESLGNTNSAALKLISDENLDFSRLLIFESQDNYHGFYYLKGRLSNRYNYHSSFINEKTQSTDFISLDLEDNVYNYKVSLELNDGEVIYNINSKVFDFDFSSILLILICTITLIFLRKKQSTFQKRKISN